MSLNLVLYADPQQPLPSDDDIAKRLAKLQGLDPAKVTQPPVSPSYFTLIE